MEIQEINQGAVTVLKVSGPLNGEAGADFKLRAMEAARRCLGRVVVDAAGVPFADSQGIECLVDVTEALAEGGRSLKLCGAAATVREVLELTGWAEAFEFFDDVNSGVRSFL